MSSKISGQTGRKSSQAGKQGVVFASNADGRDKKFEGYSNLKGAADAQQRKIAKGQAGEMAKGLEDEYILNLQKQIVLMEHEVKFLKEKEVDQKNSAAGYETLLKDGIPLNEHFLALKGKFNNEQKMLDKNQQLVEGEIKNEELANKNRKNKIDILKREFEEIQMNLQKYKEATATQLKNSETGLFTEGHTRDILTDDKKILFDRSLNIRQDNQEKGREITRMRYHNNKDEILKKRKDQQENIKIDIAKNVDIIEKEQNILEAWQDRNNDDHGVMKRQKAITMNLKNEHNGMSNDITNCQNRIKDLKTRKEIQNSQIADLLKDKRIVDKLNMELSDIVLGRNLNDFVELQKRKEAERAMRISKEQNLNSLKRLGLDLMAKTTFEETHGKVKLDEKLKLDQDLIDINEKLDKELRIEEQCREDLIRNRVKNSQLDSQKEMLDNEKLTLDVANKKLFAENERLEKENQKFVSQITFTIQKIDINNLLKEIDTEEMRLISTNNKQMNVVLQNMLTKWNFIVQKEVVI